jgi:hypothetical protein
MGPSGPEASGAKAHEISSLDVGAEAPTHKPEESPSIAGRVMIDKMPV